jgi:hypothetical protein
MAGGQNHEFGLRVPLMRVPGFAPRNPLGKEIGRLIIPNGHAGSHRLLSLSDSQPPHLQARGLFVREQSPRDPASAGPSVTHQSASHRFTDLRESSLIFLAGEKHAYARYLCVHW